MAVRAVIVVFPCFLQASAVSSLTKCRLSVYLRNVTPEKSIQEVFQGDTWINNLRVTLHPHIVNSLTVFRREGIMNKML